MMGIYDISVWVSVGVLIALSLIGIAIISIISVDVSPKIFRNEHPLLGEEASKIVRILGVSAGILSIVLIISLSTAAASRIARRISKQKDPI